MCFSANASILTFLIGIVGSLLLIYYANTKFKIENRIFGTFLIFISFIQLMDFVFWIDLQNKLGLNKVATIIGPILNTGQPIILWFIKLFYFKQNIFSLENIWITAINIAYLAKVIYNYTRFLQLDKLITGTCNGHLNWPWIKYSDHWFYTILMAINIFYLTNFNYSFIVFCITYFFLIVSKIYFKYNVGELWCFFGAFIPFLITIVSFYI